MYHDDLMSLINEHNTLLFPNHNIKKNKKLKTFSIR